MAKIVCSAEFFLMQCILYKTMFPSLPYLRTASDNKEELSKHVARSMHINTKWLQIQDVKRKEKQKTKKYHK
jgi:hypothetical protein